MNVKPHTDAPLAIAPMPSPVVACEVLRKELELLAGQMQTAPQLIFLRQSLHDTPEELGLQLSKIIDDLENNPAAPETIVLGYGLCGRGITGVTAKQATLVIPRVHDCIPLLLGVEQAEKDGLAYGASTFWTSPGWLAFSQLDFIRNRKARLAEYVTRFGENSALWLMEQEREWLTNYLQVRHIHWPHFGNTFMADARFVAEDASLPLTVHPAMDSFLCELLHGGKDTRRFLHLRPGETIDVDADGRIVALAAR